MLNAKTNVGSARASQGCTRRQLVTFCRVALATLAMPERYYRPGFRKSFHGRKHTLSIQR
jgi:hypothetical protein